jgi:hypothetical protein
VNYFCDTLLKVSIFGIFFAPTFVKIFRRSTNVVEICLKNLKDCNVGITEKGIYEVGRFDGLRWHDIHTKIHVDLFRLSSKIKLIITKI